MKARVLTAAEKAATKIPGKCRWCGEDVKRLDSKRRTFCCDECVHQFLIRSDAGYARKEVYKRDKGICQICGLDCSKFFSGLKKAVKGIYGKQKEIVAQEYFKEQGVPYFKWKNRSSGYDIDHEQAVVLGGGSCGLDNLRLLCINCHLEETRKLRKRLAERKKNGATYNPDGDYPDPSRML